MSVRPRTLWSPNILYSSTVAKLVSVYSNRLGQGFPAGAQFASCEGPRLP